MKTNGMKMSFGFSAVNAGQRNVVVVPQFVACSTEGSFRITAPVSRVLGVQSGDNIMFINNIDNIDKAIENKVPEIVAFCEENGLELGSVEAAIAIHKEFDAWAIAKGIPEKDAKGNYKQANERLTKADKERFVKQNFDAMLESAKLNAPEEIQDALTREGVTEEEQIEILTAFVKPKEIVKVKGSKTNNLSNLSGIGVPLTFSDTSVWKQLKADLGDDASKVSRVFDVDVENVTSVQIDNGYEVVEIKALVLGDYTDKVPARSKNGEESVEDEE